MFFRWRKAANRSAHAELDVCLSYFLLSGLSPLLATGSEAFLSGLSCAIIKQSAGLGF
jgi:hypothetical protein